MKLTAQAFYSVAIYLLLVRILSFIKTLLFFFDLLTEEQANQFFRDNSPISDGAIKTEVQRYFVWPGQATSYKIGMLKILELREKAETELGDKFDIRAFHDVILGSGAVPLTILERMVNNWIAEEKAA